MSPNAIAYVSGSCAQAYVAVGSEWYILRGNHPPAECDARIVSNFLTLARDVEVMDAGEFPYTNVAAELSRATRHWRALDMILSSVDSVLPVDLRREAARVAEVLLQEESAADYARERLLVNVTRSPLDILTGRELARQEAAGVVSRELTFLYYCGSIVERLKKAWRAVVAGIGFVDEADTTWIVNSLALALRDLRSDFAQFSERTTSIALHVDPMFAAPAAEWLTTLSYSWDLYKRSMRAAELHPPVLRLSRRAERIVAWYGVSSIVKVVDLSAVRRSWPVRSLVSRRDGTFELGQETGQLFDGRYSHDVYPVYFGGNTKSCLGVGFHAHLDAYVFVDPSGAPLAITAREAMAFLRIDESIADEAKVDDLFVLMDDMSLLLKASKAVIKDEAAARLYGYVSQLVRYERNREQASKLRARASSLFSWHSVELRLSALLARVDSKWKLKEAFPSDFENETPIPISKQLFSMLIRISEHGQMPAEFTPEDASAFANAIWNIPPETFPQSTRALLIRILDHIGRQFKEASAVRSNHLDGPEAARTAIIAHLSISRLKDIQRTVDVVSRVTNTARALNRADSARFFEDRISYVDSAMLDEINFTAALIPATVDEFLQLNLNTSEWIGAGDRLISAGDVLRCCAKMQIDVYNDLEKALSLAYRAVPFYERAEGLQYQHGKALFTHWAWSYALLGRLQARTASPEAGQSFERALEKIEHPSVRGYNNYVSAIYHIKILIARARYAPQRDALETETGAIIDLLTQVTRQFPHEAIGWHLLSEVHHEFRGDQSAALTVLDEWLEVWRGRENERGFQHLQYRAAATAMDLAIDNEELTSIALRRYIDLLVAQSGNSIAFAEFFDLYRRASRADQSAVEVYARERFPPIDSNQCELTHGAIRILFGDGASITKVSTSVHALAAIIRGPIELLPEAIEIIRGPLSRSKFVSIIVEYLTRELFELARRTQTSGDVPNVPRLLDRVERLLNVALEAHPGDVIWWTRKADIALIAGTDDPVTLAESLVSIAPQDPIIRLKAAQLLIGRQNDRAEEILLDADNLASEHPATLDRLALLAMLRGDYERGAEIYDTLLERNRLDAIALWGRGRVEQERGNSEGAFEYWLSLLRVRALASTSTEMSLAQRTALTMADLCRADTTDEISEGVRSRLILALWEESPVVARRLLHGLQIASVVDVRMVNAVLDVTRTTNDLLLARQIAQYLMASAIDTALDPAVNWASLLSERLPLYVEWCARRNVLGDLLFGAKGTYARTIAHRTWRGSEAIRTFTAEMEARILPGDLALIHEARSQERRASYYQRGYELAGRIRSLSPERIAEHVIYTIYDVALATLDVSSVPFALDRVVPGVGLCALRLVDEEDTVSKRVTAFVDSAAFNTLAPSFGATAWRVQPETIRAAIRRFPTHEENQAYGVLGIRFEHSDTRNVCAISRSEILVA